MIRIRTFPNGLRLVTEQVPSVRSCAMGLYLETGSRCESEDERGLTHFIEHMLFKGTRTRDVRRIAETMNYLGGNVNAFTTHEMLCLHARTIDHKAPEALDLLSEMLVESIFPEDEIRRERQVILEELRMVEDTPDDYSVDLFMENLWPGHPLGEPVIGRRQTIRRFTRDQILDYCRRYFRPDRLVVAIAGSFDARRCTAAIRRLIDLPPAGTRRGAKLKAPNGTVTVQPTARRRPTEQVHFCLGSRAPHRLSPDRFAFGLLNMVLGGGMSSRLFLEIRERRGLAYSIGSFMQSYSDSGYFAVSGGTSPRTLREVLRIPRAEIDRICDEPVPDAELELARAQILDAIIMGLENTETRVSRLADSLIAHGRVVPIDELMERVSAVQAADVQRAAQRYLRRPLAMALVGPSDDRRWTREALKETA